MTTFTQLAGLKQKIFDKLDKFLPFGLSIKLALGAILTALGGAGFLGYVSDYATYSYAIHLGFRSPLEGVPYIKAAVTASSLFLLLTCAVIFAGALVSFRFVLASVQTTSFYVHLIGKRLTGDTLYKAKDFNELLSLMRSRSLVNRIALSFACGFSMLFLAWVALWIFPNLFSGQLLDREFLIAAFAYGLLSMAGLTIPAAIWSVAFICTISYFGICVWAMFQVDQYSRFLRVIGYGGGFPIEIQCKHESSCSKVVSSKVGLMLRTNEIFVVYDANKKVFLEVPKGDIESISYRTGGLNRQAISIPVAQ